MAKSPAQLDAEIKAVTNIRLLDSVNELKVSELKAYALERALRIALQTPGGENQSWDDTEDWLIDAAELAHAVVRLLQS